jgi:YesN/AraC family two-component response regulator
MLLNEKLSGLLTLLMRESWNPDHTHSTAGKKQNLLQIKEYLEQHYTEKVSLDQLAATFYVNKFYLTRIYKEQFGISIGSYLLSLRITRAKQLLRFTDEPLDAISAACGMGDAAYLSRMFKKVEGITPAEFRKRW